MKKANSVADRTTHIMIVGWRRDKCIYSKEVSEIGAIWCLPC
ncbi:MAG: hypothetical protein ACLTER_17705 [Ruminococcus sp.]